MMLRKSLSTYFPGILLFLAAVLISLLTYQDYGMAWDEPAQVEIGKVNYDYVVHGDKQLLSFSNKEYGAGFEIPLMLIQRKFHITDTRDIYLMRHLVAHLFFLISVLCGYVLIYRLFQNQFLACLGFLMLALAPRIYAHSYFNTKDIPALSMFLISFTIFHAAFKDRKALTFLLLGAVCGYTTGIRVMGILLVVMVIFFLAADIVSDVAQKKRPVKNIVNTLLFFVGFCLALYISWPYLWGDPINNFVKAYDKMAHYGWDSKVLLLGKFEKSQHLPITYFPVWFLLTNPILWLVTGFTGILWLTIDAIKSPLGYLKNTNNRNFLLYLACFTGPVFAVIYMRSVIYDDWRHLYFVYPPFVLLALYAIHKVLQSKYKLAIQSMCLVQLGFIGYFMVRYHPVQQVYFNSLVSHEKEYLRKNFDYEYWGAGYLQALEHIVHIRPWGQIKLCYGPGGEPLTNNIMMMQTQDRTRFEIVDSAQADFFITNYRWHPDSFPNPIEFAIVVQNSTAVCVYKVMH